MHAFQWNKYGDPPPPNLITRKSPAARSDSEAIEAYITEMDKHSIVLAVGSGELDMVEKMQARLGPRFLGGIEFPKYTKPVNRRIEDWPDTNELLNLFQSGKIKIMGEITAQYAGVAPNDPRLEPYFAMAEKLDIPVCLHTGFGPPMSPYMGDPEFRMRYGNPLLLEDVLVRHPRLRIYIAHGGYPFLDETIALMLMYRQVYMDISAIDWLLTKEGFHDYLKQLIRARLEKRIMFGTDQMIWPETVEMSIEAIDSAGFLSKEQKQRIFFDNAATFLRLDKSKYLPGKSLKTDEVNSETIKVIRSEMRLRPATVGDKLLTSFNLNSTGFKSAAVQVTGFDIDAVSEAEMVINGHKISLPEDIVGDMTAKTVTIEVDKKILKEGKNTVTFVFADAVGGTTGFSILAFDLILRKK
ncbi:MAG: amidohydrolase family protein [Deltaproteobacteria bacterium]|nr:amidohydrolase family protein [Deltaproteobacteria bacterium]